MPFHRYVLNHIPVGQLIQFADSDRLYKVAACDPNTGLLGIQQWRLDLTNPTEDEAIVFDIMES